MLTSKTSLKLPIFDVSKPLSPSCLSSLSLACKEWGFFHIINHGISKELYNKLHFLSNQLFDLPYEQKLKVGPSSDIKTYTPHFIIEPQSSSGMLLNLSKDRIQLGSNGKLSCGRQNEYKEPINPSYGVRLHEMLDKKVKEAKFEKVGFTVKDWFLYLTDSPKGLYKALTLKVSMFQIPSQ
ncbi:gibberellin 20 oxidase-like protein [Tanacetum coccineum]